MAISARRRALLARFAGLLQQVRVQAGRPSYAALQREDPQLRTSTISDVLAGRTAASLDFTLSFIRACCRVADRSGVPLPADLRDDDWWRNEWVVMQRALGDARRDRTDHTEEARAAAVGKDAKIKPSQLPGYVPLLFGREAELARLDEVALPGRIVVIDGGAGVGKSSLVIGWAQRNRSRFPDGQLFVDLRGVGPGRPGRPLAVLQELLRALGVPPKDAVGDLDVISGLFRSVTAERRLLVVLDNARDADQVRPLLPGQPNCTVLITARAGLHGLVIRENALRLSLNPLTPTSAVALLTSVVAPDDAGDRESLARIAAACDYIPLALRIAGERLRARRAGTAPELAAELTDLSARLDLLSSPDGDESVAVRSTLSWSYSALPEADAAAFRLVGLHLRPEFSVDATAALLAVPVAEAGRRLSALATAHLVREVDSGRFHMHDLVWLLARELATTHEPERDRAYAERRLLDWYLQSAAQADKRLAPQRRRLVVPSAHGVRPMTLVDQHEALEWCDREQANLAAVVSRAVDLGDDDVVWRLTHLLMPWFNLRKPWSMWISCCRMAAGAAARLGDRGAEAGARNGLAIAYREVGRLEEAAELLEQVVRSYRESGDTLGEGLALGNLGAIEDDRGDHERALQQHRHALALFEKISDGGGTSIALHNIAEAEINLGRYRDALRHASRALTLSQTLGDTAAVGITLATVAEAQAGLGQVEDAVATFELARELRRAAGDRQGDGIVLLGLGRLAARMGDFDQAERHLTAAAEAFEELGDPLAERARAQLAEIDRPATRD